MNRQEWKSEILGSLSLEGRMAGLSGKSRFDVLLAQAHDLVDAGAASELVEGVMLAGAEGTAKPAEWWLALLLFLDGYNFQLNSSLRTKVISFAENDSCVDPIARGYLLRNVVDLGLPLNWNRLENQGFYSSLLNHHPLLLADALVRSGEGDRAWAALRAAKSLPHVQDYHISEMYGIWKDAGLAVPSAPAPITNASLLEDFRPVRYPRFQSPIGLAA